MEVVLTTPPYRTNVFGNWEYTNQKAWNMFIPYMSQYSVFISQTRLAWHDCCLYFRQGDDPTTSEVFWAEYDYVSKD